MRRLMTKNELSNPTTLKSLPGISKDSLALLDSVINCLSVPRSVIPDDEQIEYALQDLPRELKKIPPHLRDKFIVRASLATAVGLFDSAINYVWNSVINELRKKTSNFGYEMIKNIKGDKVEDNFLANITDDALLKLCRQLNILTEEGYYYLDQCRDLRNHVSAAHPSMIELDDRELINFFNRCAKYGLSDASEANGIDFKNFNKVLTNPSTTDTNLLALSRDIKHTFSAQREFILDILYSYYINTNNPEVQRTNSLSLAKKLSDDFTNPIIVKIISRHHKLQTNKDETQIKVSRTFLSELKLLAYLDNAEVVSVIEKALENLSRVHYGMNNFYNEPPFAERLDEIVSQIKPIPSVIRESFINEILTCYFGNQYGVSDAALPFYKKMIQNLTPKEIDYLLRLLINKNEEVKEILRKGWKKQLLIELIESIMPNIKGNDDLTNIYKQFLKQYKITNS